MADYRCPVLAYQCVEQPPCLTWTVEDDFLGTNAEGLRQSQFPPADHLQRHTVAVDQLEHPTVGICLNTVSRQERRVVAIPARGHKGSDSLGGMRLEENSTGRIRV